MKKLWLDWSSDLEAQKYLGLRSPLENFTLAFRLHQLSGAAFERLAPDHSVEERGYRACFALFRGSDSLSGHPVYLLETKGRAESPIPGTDANTLFSTREMSELSEIGLLRDRKNADYLLCFEDAEPSDLDRWQGWARQCAGVEAVFLYEPTQQRDLERLMFDL